MRIGRGGTVPGKLAEAIHFIATGFVIILIPSTVLAEATLRFVDEAEAWGLVFTGIAGPMPRNDLSKVNGCGIGVDDVDGDGDMDLYVVQGADSTLSPAPRNRLYLNLGDRLEEVGAAWGVADEGRGAGTVLVDMDGDRRPEILLTNLGPDRSFHNDEGRRFVPMRGPDGAMKGLDDPENGMGIAVADYDDDGWGDAYVARYVIMPEFIPESGGPCQWKGLPVMCGPEAYRPMDDVYYHGTPGGGLIAAPQQRPDPHKPGRGMGVAVVDHNRDLRPDVYVANDASDNFLFVNLEDGWSEDALMLGTALSAEGKPEAGMGVGPGDVDGDGVEDLVVTNFDGQTHALYMARGPWFEESSSGYRLAAPSLSRLSWGAQLADFDNDGDLDLHVVNGHLYDNADDIGDGTRWRQPDDFFVSDGVGRYAPLPEGWDGVEPESGRGSALVDLDDDGRLDLVVWNLGGPARLLMNRSEGTGNWVKIRLWAAPGIPESTLPGARVELFAGGRRQVQWFRRGSSYLSCNDPRLHFGLGEAAGVDSVRVSWPYEGQTVVGPLEVGETHLIERPARP